MVNKISGLFIIFVVVFLFVGNVAFANIPQLISVQGRLTDNFNIPYTTSQNIEFSIWNSVSGGSQLWSDTFTVTPDNVGLFDVTLGSNAVLSLSFDIPYYLQVKIGGETLSPRYSMTSAGYAFSVGPGKLSGPIEIEGDIKWTGSVLSGSVPWGRLTGVPSGLNDGDQVGISSESDPLSIHTSGGTITGDLVVNSGSTGVYSTGGSTGVEGGSVSGNGVVGTSSSATGVWGGSTTGNGVYGSTDGDGASGVFGNNGGSGNGVAGMSVSGYSGYFNGGLGVYVDGNFEVTNLITVGSGGIKYPDGTVQTSASGGSGITLSTRYDLYQGGTGGSNTINLGSQWDFCFLTKIYIKDNYKVDGPAQCYTYQSGTNWYLYAHAGDYILSVDCSAQCVKLT